MDSDSRARRGWAVALMSVLVLVVLMGAGTCGEDTAARHGGHDAGSLPDAVGSVEPSGSGGSEELPDAIEDGGTLDSSACAAIEEDRGHAPLELEGMRLRCARGNPIGISWSYSTMESPDSVVRDVLGSLDMEGYRIDYSLTLDLFGDSWGCVATSEDADHVLIVFLQPEVIGTGVGEGRLDVTVIEVDIPHGQGDSR